MVKETRLDWKYPWSLYKHKPFFLKLAVSILLIGLAFRLFVSQSISFSPVSESPFREKTGTAETHVTEQISHGGHQGTQKGTAETHVTDQASHVGNQGTQKDNAEKCDLFTGDWIPNPSGPVYTNESCHVVTGHQNCMKNGRPDSGYLYWRWKPRDCELPLFDPERFMDSMRSTSWAFIGDSISRNHVQSLLCILSKVEEAVEVYHDKDYQSKRWFFPIHNFTLSVIWSPFLVKAIISEDMNGVSSSEVQVYLDTLNEIWLDQYQSFDYIIISSAKWFLKPSIYWENNKMIGCHYCPGKNLTDFKIEDAYRRALQLALNFIATSNHKGSIFLRTSTPDHFENGEWSSGGTCNRTVPFKEGEVSLKSLDEMLREIELEEFKKAEALSLERGVNLKLLDTNPLSLLRPDGHPGPYRQFQPFAQDRNAQVQNDCLHWCLPGPIDSWNDLIMEMVLNG